MNSYTKVLISSVAGLLATQVEAQSIHNSCLTLSDKTIGETEFSQQFITNESGLTNGSVTPDMRLDGFVVCTDEDRTILGLQFFLTETPYLVDDYAPLLLLPHIGQMTGECGSLRFSGPVEQVKAASKNGNGIQGIEFHYDDKVVRIGEISGRGVDTEKWNFTEEQMLVGLYGEASPNGIEKLGMISYGTVCQAELDAAPATDDGEDKTGEEEVVIDFQPVNEATLIPNPPSGTAGGNTEEEKRNDHNGLKISHINTEELKPVETTEESSSLSTFTWLIIIFGATGFLVLVGLTIVALRRGLGTKAGDSPVTVAPVTPIKNQKKKVNDPEAYPMSDSTNQKLSQQ